jgi:type I restriction enzyme S subunit
MELRLGYKRTEVGVIPEDWECLPIADLAAPIANAIVGGPFGSDLVSADYVHDGVPVIRGQNMGGRYLEGPYAYVTEAKANSLSANLAQPGDVVFTQRGTLGQVSLTPNEPFDLYLVSQSQMKVTLHRDKVTPDFLFSWFESNGGQQSIASSAIQTGVPHINLGILKSLMVPIPQVAEQRAIATALSDVDALLTRLDRLIAKKRDIKQAAMQQLLTGKTRLPGFGGEWKTKRLGEVLTICHGRSQREVEVRDGPYPILATGGQIGTASEPLYDKPSVLIGRKGTIDAPQYMDTPFWTVDTLFYSMLKGQNNAKFFYYRFCLIDWMQLNEASGVPSLNAGTIEGIDVACPEPAEQTAIATLLSDLDAELAALEARRDKTRALKQGMMQALLTGKTRLI